MITIDLPKEKEGVNIHFTGNVIYTKDDGSDKNYATKEYVDGKIAALNFPDVGDFETKEAAADKLQEAKDYTDEAISNIDIPELPTLAKVAESGSYNDLKDKPNIPSLNGYATETYVQQQIGSINEVLTSIING